MNHILIGRIADHTRGTAQILPYIPSKSKTIADGTTESLTFSGLQGSHHVFVANEFSWDFAAPMGVSFQIAGGLGITSLDVPISLFQLFTTAIATDEGQPYAFPFPFVIDGVNALEVLIQNSSGADRLARMAIHGIRLMPMEGQADNMIATLRLAGVFVPETATK